MAQPFLTVVTRHLPARADLLERNQASLRAQTDQDYEQVVITDFDGGGFKQAVAMLRNAAHSLNGRYVLILDDDDVIEDRHAISILKSTVGAGSPRPEPPAVIFRGRHAELGVLPGYSWLREPVRGDIGVFDFVLRADVYKTFVETPIINAYAFDHDLISAVYAAHGSEIVWLDRIICAADRRRLGAAT